MMNRRNWLKYLSLGSVAGLLPGAIGRPASKATPTGASLECLTTDDILGPFYIPDTPQTTQLADLNVPGTVLLVTGTVYGRDCTTPLPNTKVEVWHASDAGDYSNQEYRGTLFTDASGNYSYATVLPGKYLNGAQFRPRHLHYKVSYADAELVTQIYFSGDSSIPTDPWASNPDAVDRIIDLTTDADGQLHGVADVYLDADLIINSTDETPDERGASLHGVFPQPVPATGSQLVLQLSRAVRAEVRCYDLQGRLIGFALPPDRLAAGEHRFTFLPQTELGLKMAAGIYILRLYANEQAVDAKRVVVA